jgi:hypothetical protein
VNQIRLRLGLGVARRVEQEDAKRRVQADNHHEVVGRLRRAGMPRPARRPDQGQGIEQETQRAKDRECDLQKLVSGWHFALQSEFRYDSLNLNTSALVQMVQMPRQDPYVRQPANAGSST